MIEADGDDVPRTKETTHLGGKVGCLASNVLNVEYGLSITRGCQMHDGISVRLGANIWGKVVRGALFAEGLEILLVDVGANEPEPTKIGGDFGLIPFLQLLIKEHR